MEDDPFDDFRVTAARLCLCAGVVVLLLGLALVYRPGNNAGDLFQSPIPAHGAIAEAGSAKP